MSATPKQPFAGRGWIRRPTFMHPTGPAEVWERRDLRVLSSLAPMEAPDGSKDVLPTWLVSCSRYGASMPTDEDMKRVRRDFDMNDAEEDNHLDGRVRGLFLVVDPARRTDCECKATEETVVRPDGFRFTRPKR